MLSPPRLQGGGTRLGQRDSTVPGSQSSDYLSAQPKAAKSSLCRKKEIPETLVHILFALTLNSFHIRYTEPLFHTDSEVTELTNFHHVKF